MKKIIKALFIASIYISALVCAITGCMMDAPEEIFRPAFIALAISIGWLALAGLIAGRRHG